MVRTTARYAELDAALRQELDLNRPRIDLERATGSACELHTYRFESKHASVHPRVDFDQTDPTLRALVSYYLEHSPASDRCFFRNLQSSDREVAENNHFRYMVFAPKGPERRWRRGTLLFHGLNEKLWHKYLPWGLALVERTRAPVVLFPIAFHMNRAPEAWANPREMTAVAGERRRLFPGLNSGSFANAALSHRVGFAPHRFITSGLQSYGDSVDLARQLHEGRHALFDAGARLDIFGYSIGASLGELLLMGNTDGLFAGSRGFLFCGGSVLDHASPVSRTIVDDQAYLGLRRYFRELVESPESALPRSVASALPDPAVPTMVRSLLFRDRLRAEREAAVRPLGSRLQAVVLERDRVFSAAGFAASWTDEAGRPLIALERADPSYDYSHEQPFPPGPDAADDVDRFYRYVFDRAAEHLAGG